MMMPQKCKECLEVINKKHQEDLDFQRRETLNELNGQIEALQRRVGNFYSFLRERKLINDFEEWEFKDMPEKEIKC